MNELRGPLVVLATMCIYHWSLNRKIRELELKCKEYEIRNEFLVTVIEDNPQEDYKVRL